MGNNKYQRKTLLHVQVTQTGREKKGKRNQKKNLENLYVIFNENPAEINRQNIDVKETELNKCKGCTN